MKGLEKAVMQNAAITNLQLHFPSQAFVCTDGGHFENIF